MSATSMKVRQVPALPGDLPPIRSEQAVTTARGGQTALVSVAVTDSILGWNGETAIGGDPGPGRAAATRSDARGNGVEGPAPNSPGDRHHDRRALVRTPPGGDIAANTTVEHMPARRQRGITDLEIGRGDFDTRLGAIKEALRAWLMAARTPPAHPQSCRRAAPPPSSRRSRRTTSKPRQGFAVAATPPSGPTRRGTQRKPCRQWCAKPRTMATRR